jgi:hypothetical protein
VKEWLSRELASLPHHRSCWARHGVGISTLLTVDAIRQGNHSGESLQSGVVSRDIADAHEQMLEALNIDAHNLWDEFANLVLLTNMLVGVC